MKFYPLVENNIESSILESEYKSGRQIGVVRLGDTCLQFKVRRKNYYIPYSEIEKCYRRVMGVNMKLCCGKGELRVEHLVISDADNNELAVIQLPGTKAAKELMDELRVRAPKADFSAPKRDESGEIVSCSKPQLMEA